MPFDMIIPSMLFQEKFEPTVEGGWMHQRASKILAVITRRRSLCSVRRRVERKYYSSNALFKPESIATGRTGSASGSSSTSRD